MKMKLIALSLIACSGSAYAGYQYFDEPRATPEGAPAWVNLPIALGSENKYCQERGFWSGSPATITYNSDTSMYAAVNSLNQWEAKSGNMRHDSGVHIVTRVLCY